MHLSKPAGALYVVGKYPWPPKVIVQLAAAPKVTERPQLKGMLSVTPVRT